MTDAQADAAGDALAARLGEIEAQPLADRAAAYAALHDELTRALETAPGAAPGPSRSTDAAGGPTARFDTA